MRNLKTFESFLINESKKNQVNLRYYILNFVFKK